MILRITTAKARAFRISLYRAIHISKSAFSEALRDENIKARYVRIVDAETGALSSDAKHVSRLLQGLDRTKYWLVQVKSGKLDADKKELKKAESSSSKKGNISNRTNDRRDEARQREEMEAVLPLEDLAIVKLVDKKEAYNRQREKRLERKDGKKMSVGNSTTAHKEVDISWNSTPHDIEHKLKTLQSHLRRKGPGARCTVTIKPKAQQGRNSDLSIVEKKEMIRKITEDLCDWSKKDEVEGDEDEDRKTTPAYHARQAREVEWKDKNKRAMIFFEVVKGTRVKSS